MAPRITKLGALYRPAAIPVLDGYVGMAFGSRRDDLSVRVQRFGLNWGWVKELCEYGMAEAVATGQWTAMATSTFCGPQFVGMWRDIAWHRGLTGLVHAGRCPRHRRGGRHAPHL